jgi:hypothetical protein
MQSTEPEGEAQNTCKVKGFRETAKCCSLRGRQGLENDPEAKTK